MQWRGSGLIWDGFTGFTCKDQRTPRKPSDRMVHVPDKITTKHPRIQVRGLLAEANSNSCEYVFHDFSRSLQVSFIARPSDRSWRPLFEFYFSFLSLSKWKQGYNLQTVHNKLLYAPSRCTTSFTFHSTIDVTNVVKTQLLNRLKIDQSIENMAQRT